MFSQYLTYSRQLQDENGIFCWSQNAVSGIKPRIIFPWILSQDGAMLEKYSDVTVCYNPNLCHSNLNNLIMTSYTTSYSFLIAFPRQQAKQIPKTWNKIASLNFRCCDSLLQAESGSDNLIRWVFYEGIKPQSLKQSFNLKHLLRQNCLDFCLHPDTFLIEGQSYWLYPRNCFHRKHNTLSFAVNKVILNY